MRHRCDVAVIGGGIVGLATAHALVDAGCSVIVLEGEDRVAFHQSGRNSGVIHSGLYYRPGSLKAETCRAGREAMYQFCEEREIPHRRTGKLVVATDERELTALDELERRGRTNGLLGLRRLSRDDIQEIEPNVSGIAGLWVAETGIVDFSAVTEALVQAVRQGGGHVETGARVRRVAVVNRTVRIRTARLEVEAAVMINCGGLQSDRLARRYGLDPGIRIVPFRGEYFRLRSQRRDLIRTLIYPVPDPALPFLGVHLTKGIDGHVEAGPSAVLAFKREGYHRTSLSVMDLSETLTYRGFWRMARRHWRAGIGEFHRSMSRKLFLDAVRRLVPSLELCDLTVRRVGVRAQAVGPDGRLLDDFHIVEDDRSVHVLNAPSPAATASLIIGRTVAGRALAKL